MKLVVDASEVIAAFIARGKTHEILFSGKAEFVAPERLLAEVERHKEGISSFGKISLESVESSIEILKDEIKVFPRDEYRDKLSEAEKMSPHPKDIEYFALALSLDCGIWSNEKAFKKQSRVKVFPTHELKRLLGME